VQLPFFLETPLNAGTEQRPGSAAAIIFQDAVI
jgi:hypothetical protein